MDRLCPKQRDTSCLIVYWQELNKKLSIAELITEFCPHLSSYSLSIGCYFLEPPYPSSSRPAYGRYIFLYHRRSFLDSHITISTELLISLVHPLSFASSIRASITENIFLMRFSSRQCTASSNSTSLLLLLKMNLDWRNHALFSVIDDYLFCWMVAGLWLGSGRWPCDSAAVCTIEGHTPSMVIDSITYVLMPLSYLFYTSLA